MLLHFWRHGKSHSSEGGDPWQMAHEAEAGGDPRNGCASGPGRGVEGHRTAMAAKGHRISHEGVAGVLKGRWRYSGAQE
jgi:hypothetical protein